MQNRGGQNDNAGSTERLRGAALAALLAQLLAHAFWHVKSRNPAWLMAPRLVACLHDALLIALLYFSCVVIARAFGGRARPAALRWVGTAAWAAAVFLLMLYPRQVPDFLNFPVNIFLVDAGAARAFARDFLTPGEVAFAAAAALFTAFLPRGLAWGGGGKFVKVAAFCVLAASCLALGAPSPNPFVYGIQDSVRGIFGGGREFPALRRPAKAAEAAAAADLSKGDRYSSVFDDFTVAPKGGGRPARVLIVVMETVEGARFEKEMLGDGGTFIGSRRSEFRYFSNYFTTNLDSFTSMVAMVNSVFVPYQAYSDPERYGWVQRAPGLVQAFKKNGFKSMFVSTARFQPFIPSKADWDVVITRDALPAGSPGAAPPSEKMAVIESPPVEAAVEDRAAGSAVAGFMAGNPRAFVVQECVFGHTREWIDLTGGTQLQYYDRYFRELSESLAALDSAEAAAGRAPSGAGTLMVLVADHGSRSGPGVRENYRVPLLMRGAGVAPGTDARFLSHLDFAGLIREALTGRRWQSDEKPVFTVGHSGNWVFGEIRKDGGCLFLENSRGRVIGGEGGLDPAQLSAGFQRYLDSFEARAGAQKTKN